MGQPTMIVWLYILLAALAGRAVYAVAYTQVCMLSKELQDAPRN